MSLTKVSVYYVPVSILESVSIVSLRRRGKKKKIFYCTKVVGYPVTMVHCNTKGLPKPLNFTVVPFVLPFTLLPFLRFRN